jgi:hypothetical protein
MKLIIGDVRYRQAASLYVELDEPDGFRGKEACRGNTARRIVRIFKGGGERGHIQFAEIIRMIATLRPETGPAPA